MQIRSKGKIFSPGNTRGVSENKGYMEAIKYWLMSGYTLRYSGGMAPDCYHIFKKGEGVFSCISGGDKVPSKLRVLYECLPIAFLCEKAGGASSNGEISLLDIKIEGYTSRTDIVVGSEEEVQRVNEFLATYKNKQ
jgi:sedoheptulose-bisphosphatase